MSTKNIPFILSFLLLITLILLKYFIPFPTSAYADTTLSDTKEQLIHFQRLQDIVQPRFLSIDFDFKPSDLHPKQILHMGKEHALRIELTSEGQLILKNGSVSIWMMAKKIQINHAYHCHLRTDFKDYLKINFDHQIHHLLPEQIKRMSYDLSKLYVTPEAQALKLSLIYIKSSFLHQLLKGLIGLNICILGICLLWQLKPYWPQKATFEKNICITLATRTGWSLFWTALVSILAYLGYFSEKIPYAIFCILNLLYLFAPPKWRKSLLSFLDAHPWPWTSVTILFLLSGLGYFSVVSGKLLLVIAQMDTLRFSAMLITAFIAMLFVFQTKINKSTGYSKYLRFYMLMDMSVIGFFIWLCFDYPFFHHSFSMVHRSTLLIAATLWYLMAIKYIKYHMLNRLMAVLLILSGLFFSGYAETITISTTGFSLFPFFWSYLLLAYFLWQPQYHSYYAYLGILLWIFACLSSLESAWYASFIYFSGTVTQFYYDLKPKTDRTSAMAFRYLGLPWFLLTVVLLIVVVIYQMRFGHLPTFQYYMKSADNIPLLSYTKHHWISLALFFMGLVHIYWGVTYPKKTISQIPIAAILGGVGAIFLLMLMQNKRSIQEYLPLLGFMIYFAIFITREKALGFYKITFQIVSIPILMILLQSLPLCFS
ncbi:MAG TPA: hypothetical protein VHD33_05795 [Legionellaceae bacterium]|nr:hypothetical protein [Legionellaceae bacterium]